MHSLFSELIPAAFLLLCNGKRPGQYHLQNQQARARCCWLSLNICHNPILKRKRKSQGWGLWAHDLENHSEPSRSVDCWAAIWIQAGLGQEGKEGPQTGSQEWQWRKSRLRDWYVCFLGGGSIEQSMPDGWEGLSLSLRVPDCSGVRFLQWGSCWKGGGKEKFKKTKVYFPVRFCTSHGFICWAPS